MPRKGNNPIDSDQTPNNLDFKHSMNIPGKCPNGSIYKKKEPSKG